MLALKTRTRCDRLVLFVTLFVLLSSVVSFMAVHAMLIVRGSVEAQKPTANNIGMWSIVQGSIGIGSPILVSLSPSLFGLVTVLADLCWKAIGIVILHPEPASAFRSFLYSYIFGSVGFTLVAVLFFIYLTVRHRYHRLK